MKHLALAISWNMLWFFNLLLVLFSCIPLLHSKSITSAMAATTIGRNETDRLALIAFKDNIFDDPLQVLSSWNDSMHFCEWYGVTCSRRHQRVTVIDLQSLGLQGSITPYIGNLTFLRRLMLLNNSIDGKIPNELGLLFRLQYLNLNNNSLVGKIPANLSRCTNLNWLSVGQNSLTGNVPSELGQLSKLRVLVIHKNNLSGTVPASLGNLSSLEVISATTNNFNGGISETLSQLTRLTYFSIGGNRLSGTIPHSIYNISSITIFSMLQNQLSGSLPSNLGNSLPNLQWFSVARNQFTGSLPLSLSNASKLEVIELIDNSFTGKVLVEFGRLQNLSKLKTSNNPLDSEDISGIITSLANCSNLLQLNLGYNNFGGTLPKTIGNLSNQLQTLDLQGNKITGSIPSGLQNLRELTGLSMAVNQMFGSIPTGTGKLQKLQKLYMGSNEFFGKIPTSLGNLSSLLHLDLNGNSLQGIIPSSLGKCKRLLLLDLSRNNLSGTIPPEVISLPSLSIFLNLSRNSLNGSIPTQVGALKNLGKLDISENKLSGRIPPSLGECESLEYLHMEGNFFQGIIPPSLWSLKAIQYFDLSRNNLSGEIPKYLEELPLKKLNLSFNDLEGVVPQKGIFKNVSTFSVAGNNKLCGGIPKLQLRVCNITGKAKKSKASLLLKVIIPVVCGFIALAFLSFFLIPYLLKGNKKDPHSGTPIINSLLRMSYEMLLKATNGFSDANLIGVGSFGSVYKGIIDQDGTFVAIKVLNLQHQGASKSFVAECEALRNIRHRNLLKIITACSTIDFRGNDFKALIYEFMPNQSLETWLHPISDTNDAQEESRNLNILNRLSIAIDVASALDYLHHHCEIPIIHCDLKPSNVLLDSEMVAHVGDFGLARLLGLGNNEFSPVKTSSIGIKGTIGYAAPEYGMGSKVSTQGDVYSYGILLLEMFTRKRPTNCIFKDGMNLHSFSKAALPDKIFEIIDPVLLSRGENDENIGNIFNGIHATREKLQECLTLIVRIGVACSMGSPGDRMNIKDAIKELHLAKGILLGSIRHIN